MISPADLLNSGAFVDRHEPAIGVNPADAARNRAMFGESVIKSVAGHREIRLFWFGRPQETANDFDKFRVHKNRQH